MVPSAVLARNLKDQPTADSLLRLLRMGSLNVPAEALAAKASVATVVKGCIFRPCQVLMRMREKNNIDKVIAYR